MRQLDLTKGNVTSTMLLFAVPMILGNILQQCYNLVDTWIVGQYVGSDALAAVGSAYTLMTFLTSIIIGMCMGSGALFSICVGRRDTRRLKEYILASFVLISIITVLMLALAMLLLHGILSLMQTPSEIYGIMYSYVQIILIGMIFVYIYNYFAFLLRSTGDSVAPLIFLAISTVTNIVLDYVFVAIWGMGANGAAVATVIAQAVSGIGIAAFSILKLPAASPRSFREEGIRIRRSLFKEILSYSMATGIQQSVMNFGILMIQGLVNSFGTAVMAAFAAGVKIDTLAYMPAQEFGNAYSIFISQNHGAGDRERIKKGTRSAIAVVITFCILVSVLIYQLASSLISIFISGDAEIISIGAEYLQIEGMCYCGIGVLFLLYGYFRAVEHPRISLLLTIISLGTRVLLAYTCAPAFGVTAIWWAIPIGWALADITGLLLLKKIKA